MQKQKGQRDSLSDVSQQLDEVIVGDFTAVLSVQWRKLAIHVQTSLSIFEHLPGNMVPQSHSWESAEMCHLGILGNLALCLTWPPRQRASWTDPGADMSVWQFWALSELSARPKTKKLCILDNLSGDFNVWIIQSRRGANLIYVGGFDVWLGAVRDAVL